MASRGTQQSKKYLEHKVERLETELEILGNRYQELAGRANREFEGSSTYYYLKEKIEFLDTLLKTIELNYDHLKREASRQKEALEMLYNDNQNLAAQVGSNYHIGVTTGWQEDYTVSGLKDEIRLLKSKLQNREEKIKILLDQINVYLNKLGELELSVSKKPHIGRNKLPKDIQTKILELSEKSDPEGKQYSIRRIAQEAGCSIGAVHKYLRQVSNKEK